jgi:hypothetical protein
MNPEILSAIHELCRLAAKQFFDYDGPIEITVLRPKPHARARPDHSSASGTNSKISPGPQLNALHNRSSVVSLICFQSSSQSR